jgi:outer membrane lipoprotein SlyB
MLKKRYIAVACLALAAGACANDPVRYSEPRYVAPSSYGDNGSSRDYRATVVAIDVVREGGRSSGAGAVVGGILGGVIGHQVGNGRGNDAATVAGVVGGAVVGNEVEKRRNANEESYRVTVRYRNGNQETFSQDSLDGLRVGDSVRVEGNHAFRG